MYDKIFTVCGFMMITAFCSVASSFNSLFVCFTRSTSSALAVINGNKFKRCFRASDIAFYVFVTEGSDTALIMQTMAASQWQEDRPCETNRNHCISHAASTITSSKSTMMAQPTAHFIRTITLRRPQRHAALLSNALG